MLLRYIVLHGTPKTEEAWKKYIEWKKQQLALAECHMSDTEGSSEDRCEKCPGTPDCPKGRRSRPEP